MSNPFFRFKQFTVHHDRCAMKVGTDGVLLGAWAEVGHCTEVLDVGTGTGLISLMMAQRNPTATFTAIDIDEQAVAQAYDNIINSPFADRMTVEQGDFRKYAPRKPVKFDLVVSNPPYFSNALLSPDPLRSGARHAVSLTISELMCASHRCLKQDGMLALILPFDQQEELMQTAATHGFFLKRLTIVHPLPEVPPKRLLTEWTLKQIEGPAQNSLIIERSRHQYSPEYIELVRDFYLYL